MWLWVGVTCANDEVTEVVLGSFTDLAEVLQQIHLQLEKTRLYQNNSGVFAFIGSNGSPDAPDLHHDHMTIDDAAFQVSVPYYVENAQALYYFKRK